MKSDLISRSGLGVGFCNPDIFENKAYAEGWNSLIKIIKQAPSVDAEPVRHGRWIDNGDYVTTAYGSLDVNVCSNCNAEVTIDHYDSYCPNCGAKMMDGDVDAAD